VLKPQTTFQEQKALAAVRWLSRSLLVSAGTPRVLEFIAAVISVFLSVCASTAQGPENVLLVVNAESQDSRAIANRYVELRDIPTSNVVYLKGVSNLKGHKFGEESTLSWKFKKEILQPILKAIKDRGLENQIDCIAYSAGFPTRVNFNNPELKTYLEQTGQKYNLMLHAPWASITSLTYFHRNAFSKNPDFLRLDANRYANPHRMKVLANPFTGGNAQKFDLGVKQTSEKNYVNATATFVDLRKEHPKQLSVIYALARSFAFSGETDKAIMTLGHAKEVGFAYGSLLLRDAAFLGMHSEPRFVELVSDMEDLPDGLHATRSFSGRSYWGKNGWANGNADQGERYMLSSVLAVIGENGSTLQASLDRLESSAAADGTFPDGNVYFADHKDVRSKCRRGQFPFAVAELKTLGIRASIGPDLYPVNDSRVIGASLGSPSMDWSKSKSSFLPGAICDNLTSGGADFKGRQVHLTKFLDAGAAGASGTVYEPYALQAKFPTARWHAHYARGCTLAESYYQSVSGPSQLLLVGDPLCCPYGEFPKFDVEGIDNGDTFNGDFEFEIEEDSSSAKIDRFEVFFDGVYLDKLKDFGNVPVETDAIKAGRHELRVVAVAASPVGNKSSKKFRFTISRRGRQSSLEPQNQR